VGGDGGEDYFPPPFDLSDILPSPESITLPATPILPLHDHELSSKEREEHYHLFAGAVGVGLEELQGTYKSFMDIQTREYYGLLEDYLDAPDKSTPVSVHPAHVPSPPADCNLFGDHRSRDTRGEDFKKWLLPTGHRLPASRESSISLWSEDSFSSHLEHRGVAEFIQSRRSSLSSSDSSENTLSNSISVEDVPPVLFGYIPQQAPASPPTPPQPPQLIRPPPPPIVHFPEAQTQALVEPTQEIASAYLSGAPAFPFYREPPFIHPPPNLQFYPHHHGWPLSPAEEPFLPMSFHPHHISPLHPAPAYMAQPEQFIHHPQPVPAHGFHMNGMSMPIEQGQTFISHFVAPPGHFHVAAAPPMQEVSVKSEWMDWEGNSLVTGHM
jgi:hypothetical protein